MASMLPQSDCRFWSGVCRCCISKVWGVSLIDDSTMSVLNFKHVSCQVWDNTPSVGEAPFLDSIWTALDEVSLHGTAWRVIYMSW